MGNQEDCNSMPTKPPSAINGDCSFSPQEFKKQDAAAALLLFSWKFCKLDKKLGQKLEKEKKRKPRKIIKQEEQEQRQEEVPRIPGLKGQIGNCSGRIEKLLTDSDVKEGQMRLLLSKDHVQQLFYPLLSADELVQLKDKTGISASVYDHEGRKYEMVFKLWVGRTHVLTSKNWVHFCHDHHLESQKDWVSLWMFKLIKDDDQSEKLCFYIMSRRQIDGEKQEGDGSVVVGNGCGSRRRKREEEDAVN